MPEPEEQRVSPARDPAEPLPAGMVLAGRYEVEAAIAEGGMGSVYAALDRELGERVALKVLAASHDADDEVLERFRREVRVARRVTHRNAARTFDIGEDHGLHFLTMELVEGESLLAFMHREGVLPPPRVADIGQQICDGLAAVHAAGIIHRDLKPGNVLLETSGRVVLTDFGIARSAGTDDALTVDSQVMVGTPIYMAPEQVAGESLTPRADLYALGLVLYELATGHRPFDGESAMIVALARVRRPPTPVGEYACLPGWLERAIMTCLSRSPAQRPRDAGTLRRMLSPSAVDVDTKLEGVGERTRADGSPVITARLPAPSLGVVSTDPGPRSLAVLPLAYRGPPDDAYLAEAMTEQLVDLLSMTQGLRVPAVGATRPFAEQRDPRAVGDALGVDSVIDGTVQRGGSALRVSVRLLDARTGYQTWSDHVDGQLQDVFDLQDHIATRVAETLRLRLEAQCYDHCASAEAVEHYLRARLRMRSFTMGAASPDGAAALLERCLELAPEFVPALGTYATVCSRMWFFLGSPSHGRDWVALGREAMERARHTAPNFPEGHMGAARMHAEAGEFSEAAGALVRTLELAPTHTAAHALLGTLQCEAGRATEGLRHLELAAELDPATMSPMLPVVRHLALQGKVERLEVLLQRLWDEDPSLRIALMATRVRYAVWWRDTEALRRARDVLAATQLERGLVSLAVAGYVLGEGPREAIEQALDRTAPVVTSSPRFRTLLEQIFVEGLLAAGDLALALERLEQLAEGILVDVDWLEHCPLFAALASEPRMWEVSRRVRERAQAIWAVR